MAIADTITRLLLDHGEAVTYRANKPGIATDLTKPWKPSSSLSPNTDIIAVFLDFHAKAIDGTVIQQGDQKALVAGDVLADDPVLNDEILRGGEVWRVLNIMATRDKGVNLLYELHVRR